MTFLDMQQMRQVGSPTPSPDRRWLLYTLSTPDWKEAKRQTDLYLVSMQTGVVVDAAADVHEGEERNLAALGAGRQLLLLPVEPRSAGERGDAQSALRDAARRRRSAPAHRYARKACRTTRSAATAAGSPIAAARAARNSCIGCRPAGDRDRDRGTNHQAPDRRAHLAMGARQQAHLLRDAGSHRRGREGAAREEIHRQHPQRRNAGRQPVGARSRPASPPSASPTAAPTPWTTSRSPTTASGSASADCRRPLQARHHRRELYSDLYLLEAATGTIERLTNNAEIGESGLSFSPDSRQVAFSAPDDLETYSMTNDRVYVRAIADRGKPFRKLGTTVRRRRQRSASGPRTAARSISTRASRRPTRSSRSTCATTRCAR